MQTAPSDPSSILPDAVLAGSLMTAPAWGTWLTEVDHLLSTATLAVGFAIGCARLWLLWRGHRDRSREN